MDFYYITIKLVTAMAGLWIITKLLGKKEISQLTAFDFVSSLMLSEIVGNTVYDREVPLAQLVYALVLWTALSFVLEKLVQWFPGLSKHLNGSADLVIIDGKIDFAAMKRNNLDFDQLHTLLREQNIFSIREVGFAVFETNGNISVKKKASAEAVTKQDLQLPDEPVSLSVVLVENGRVQKRRLEQTGRSAEWLLEELQKAGAARISDVLYAEWDEQKGMFSQLKE